MREANAPLDVGRYADGRVCVRVGEPVGLSRWELGREKVVAVWDFQEVVKEK